jgi:hypothetical protein
VGDEPGRELTPALTLSEEIKLDRVAAVPPRDLVEDWRNERNDLYELRALAYKALYAPKR